MRPPLLSTILLSALSSSASSSLHDPPQQIFSNPSSSNSKFRIPSIHESTLQARRILHLQNIATFSTTFPPLSSHNSSSDDFSTLESRPDSVASTPIGLMEYYATCDPAPYNPTILGVTLATTMKNSHSGSNTTLSLRYHLPTPPHPLQPPDHWSYLPANLPRFALVGYLEKLPLDEVLEHNIRECFLKSHPEARIWEPGTDIHESWWGRLVVEEVYFFGGFGDRARIGWLPIEEWRGIEESEVRGYRLVGEEGWEEMKGKRGGRVDL